MNKQMELLAQEAAEVYYDAHEFIQDLGNKTDFINELKPYIVQAIKNWERYKWIFNLSSRIETKDKPENKHDHRNSRERSS